ncbi:MAG TPA: MFS transporter [Ktedonobacterales bacterium]|nr:MFS transporter [Ktedonobacterales bacterium]
MERGISKDEAIGRRGRLLTAATFSQFGGSVAHRGTEVLGVFFAAAYQLSLAQMGTMIAVLTLGLVLSGLVVGSLVDRYGPRRVLFVGTLLLLIPTTVIATVHLLPVTVAMLFVLGLLLATVPITGMTAILMASPPERRGLPMGIRQMAVPAGVIVAALVLPTLATRYGPHPLYVGFAVLIAITGLAFCAVLPGQPVRIARASHDGPLLRSELSRLAVPALCGFLMSWGQIGLTAYTIPFLHDRHGISLAAAGVLLAVSQVGAAGARIFLGYIADRLSGRYDQVLLATAVSGAILAGVVAVLPRGFGILALVSLWFLLGAAMVGWNALMLTWSGERVSARNTGAAMGLTTSAILLGAAIAAPGFGLIVEAGGYQSAWLALGAILMVVAVILWANMRLPVRWAQMKRSQSALMALGERERKTMEA